mgnify:CR=1 FL=1
MRLWARWADPTRSATTWQACHPPTPTGDDAGDRDFTRRVGYAGPPDEVGRLASTFNQMLSSLKEAYQKVEHAPQMQRDFVADVSHELRTPLTTLRGNLGLLRHDLQSEERVDVLDEMDDESDRLIRLLNELLLLARADAERSLAQEPVDVQSVIQETVRQVRLNDPQRQVNLQVPPGLELVGDLDAFKQVMIVLLDNALKHSDGEIDLQVFPDEGRIIIRVRDYGAGIAADILSHVFGRFYRGEDQAGVAGFGLGLPIARALVAGMGGEITIESRLGEGSLVRVQFPASAAG